MSLLAIDLLVLLLCVAAAFVVDAAWSSRRLTRSANPIVRRGPVPGYSRAEPSAFRRADIDRILPEYRDLWTVSRVETFNSGSRRRLVVGVSASATLSADAVAKLARALQFASGAEVAAVELVEGERADGAWAVASPDGGGWTGQARQTVLTFSRDGLEVVTQGAVAALGPVPATGWFVPPLDPSTIVA